MSGNRVTIYKTAAKAVKAFTDVEAFLDNAGLDPLLRHLIKLRVSQINGCAFCVNMHIREAREDNEAEARLDHLVVWRHVDDYTPAERAALAWAEALTTRGTGENLTALHRDIADHFSQEHIDAITLVVVMINNWNRMQIALHNEQF
ncbi:carboxymuconolactone decarboxylase family protein [Pyruvatibacter mobilis]|uniref:carboxymuconolactone decarboxylase family protein n=1 Tax=Pyruvatibacter mobilis TaxID=1712261 RepID=UPI003BAB4EFD